MLIKRAKPNTVSYGDLAPGKAFRCADCFYIKTNLSNRSGDKIFSIAINLETGLDVGFDDDARVIFLGKAEFIPNQTY